VGDARAQEAASESARDAEPALEGAQPLPGSVPLAGVPVGPWGVAFLTGLSRSAGNRRVGALLQRQPTGAAAAAPAATPTVDPETRVRTALAASPPDFKAAFRCLNGLSLAHMLTTLAKLKATKHLEKLRAAGAELAKAGVFVERIELAMSAVEVAGTVSVSTFEITHGHLLAKVEADGRDAVLAFIDPRFPTLKRLRESAGFGALGTDEAIRFMTYVGGQNREISQGAFAALDAAIKAGTVDLTKVESLRKFFKAQAGALDVVPTPPGSLSSKRDTYTVGTATDVARYRFRSRRVDAKKSDVSVGSASPIVVPVYRPKTPDAAAGDIPTVDAVAKGLAALPKSSLKLVKRVDIEPAQNPDDAHWARVYRRPGFRSYMTAGKDGVVNIYPTLTPMSQDYLEGTMVHETGHTLSGQKWGEESSRKWKPWKDAMKSDVVVPSKYAKSSPGEDFAETLVVYFQTKGTPQEQEIRILMPARIKIIEDLLKP
jgi:hypothetical protein